MTTDRAEFASAPRSVAQARRFVLEALEDAEPALRRRAELLVSELATNAVKHAGSGFRLRVERPGGDVRIEVSDEGPGHPERRWPSAAETSGRGLLIVEALSDEWGVIEHPRGKAVWFELRRGSGGRSVTGDGREAS